MCYLKFPHPRWLCVCQRFGSHSWRGSKVGGSPPIFSFWGHIPQTPWEGAAPPPPPVQCRVFSKRLTSAGVKGDTPRAPRHGGSAPPGPPVFPPSWAFGLASVLGPTRGMVAGGGYSPPNFGLGPPPLRRRNPFGPPSLNRL